MADKAALPIGMQPSEEDIAWFKSTFHPIPRPVLPDDCIEYNIHLLPTHSNPINDDDLRTRLREVQKYAAVLQKDWLRHYVWQRQGFSLETTKEDGLTFLKGRTEYGDSIEDEWVIVWLLREISKKFDNIWVKVTDSDGEFLLIEASGTIPGWLEPDVAENRVWINRGHMKIIKPANASRSSKRMNEKLSLLEALQIMMREPERIMHTISIEEEAFYRLRNYPSQIQDNIHHALVTLPRKVAFLLCQKPAYIAPAVEAFYLRDPIALKTLRKDTNGTGLIFPPRDLVSLSVKFPKVGYAQIKSQDFPPPPAWTSAMPPTLDARQSACIDTGMKVTCGFEMLLSDAHHQDKQAVREMRMLLDDLETGDELLPTDTDLSKIEAREDDEKWLDVDFADLERELEGKRKGELGGKKPEFGDRAAQENLQRIVKQFEDFLNADTGSDPGNGIADDSSELDEDGEGNDVSSDAESDSGEDKTASFDEDEFTRMMQEMMGMPSDVMREIMSGKIDALSGQSSQMPPHVHDRVKAKIQEVDSSDEDIEDMKQMEAELHASGALHIGSESNRGKTSHQLQQRGDVEDESEDEGLNDFDADFARNILQSFRSSRGMGGPAANLMSMMGDPDSGQSSSKSRKKEK